MNHATNSHPRAATALFLFILLSVLATCAHVPPALSQPSAATAPGMDDALTLWATGDARKVLPDAVPETHNTIWDADKQQVTLRAARNETAAFQLILSTSAPLRNVDVIPGAFSGTGDRATPTITLYRQGYYAVGTNSDPWGAGIPVAILVPGAIPDPLIPFVDPYDHAHRVGAPFAIPAGRSQALWVDIAIPVDWPAGDYTTTFTVTVQEQPVATISLLLHIWDFTLADRSSLRVFVPSDPLWTLPSQYNVPETVEAVAPLANKMNQALFAHRLIPGSFLHRPQVSESSDTLALDFSEIDAEMTPYMDAGLSLFFLPDPWDGVSEQYSFRNGQGDYYEAAAFDDPLFVAKATQYYRVLRDHYAAAGWLDKAVAYPVDETEWVADEPLHNGPAGFQRLQQWSQLIKAADTTLRVSAASVYPAPPGPPERGWVDLRGWVDDWQVVADDVESNPSLFQKRQALGETISYYLNDYGDFIDYKATLHRALAWDAFLYDAYSVQGWAAAAWIDEDLVPHSPWTSTFTGVYGHGGGAFFWPGYHIEDDPNSNIDGPLPSLRLKMLRQSLNDFDYLTLLAAATSDAYAHAVARTLIPTDLFHADPAAEDLYAQRAWIGSVLSGERPLVPITLTGQVTDADSGIAVAAAWVQAAHTATRSDSSGVYTLPVGSDDTAITINHPHYRSQTLPISTMPLNAALSPLPITTTSLFSFETDAEIAPELWEYVNVLNASRSREHATDGDWSFSILFDDNVGDDAEAGTEALPLSDWRGYDALELDVTNQSDYTTELEVGIADSQNGWYPSSGGIFLLWPHTARHISIPTAEIAGDVDLSSVVWLSLAPETVTAQTDYQDKRHRWPLGRRHLFIDNIRLLRGIAGGTPTPTSTQQWLPWLLR